LVPIFAFQRADFTWKFRFGKSNDKTLIASYGATSAGDGASSGASGSNEATAPQEREDARESGELAPSRQNDPGNKTSPPASGK
jgi:hypothetical protein